MNLITPEEPNNIVAINPEAAKELEITRKYHEGKFACSGLHKHVEVDSVKRTLTCKHCGFAVDPFEYVEQWALEGERRMTGIEGLEARLKVTQAEYEDLKRRVNNIRAQLKRAGEPQTATERHEWDRKRWNADLGRPSFAVVSPEQGA